MQTLFIADFQWDRLLQRPPLKFSREGISQFHQGKTVLVTGGGGSIGSGLVRSLLEAGADNVIALDWSENALVLLDENIGGATKSRLVLALGDVRDQVLLPELLQRHRPDIIYHAAAHKHVPLCEVNPFAVAGNNTLGTYALARAAKSHHVPRVVMVSTDKAARPSSMLGASKRAAEQILLALFASGGQAVVVRLGNVLLSEGSVVPIFLQEIAGGAPLTITDSQATRYFLALEEAVDTILYAGATQMANGILLPEMGEPIAIVDLARHLLGLTGSDSPIVYTGLRFGEKLHEDLISQGESVVETLHPRVREIRGPVATEEDVTAAIEQLEEAISSGNLPSLLNAVTRIVPEYQPSAYLQGAATARAVSLG